MPLIQVRVIEGVFTEVQKRQIVHKLLTDVEGLEEIVDRVRVSEMPSTWRCSTTKHPGWLL